MLSIDYEEDEGILIIESSDGWDDTIREIDSVLRHFVSETEIEESENQGLQISIPALIQSFGSLIEIISYSDHEVEFTSEAEEIFVWVREILTAPEEFREELSPEEIQKRLDNSGWNSDKRPLSDFQLRNLIRTSRRDNAAIFSVPGAGKTVEALAYSVVVGGPNPVFLIVCPRNAYSSWERELNEALGIEPRDILRGIGNDNEIKGMLSRKRPYRAVLVNYNRLWIRYRAFSHFLRQAYKTGKTTMAIFDESHHFKGGKAFTSGVKRVSPFASHRVILTGTPMPRSPADLVHQFSALMPSRMGQIDEENVLTMTQGRFVRTTKGDLGLRDIDLMFHEFPMDEHQRNLYELLTNFYVAESASGGNRRVLAEIIRLQNILIYIVMVTSNPTLIDHRFESMIGDLDPEISHGIRNARKSAITEGSGPKIRFACERARELASEGKKVLIWSSFVENVYNISEELEDLGAVFIRGDVPTSENSEEGYLNSVIFEDASTDEMKTREERIQKFKTDESCMVLVANPSAAGEGISLHDVCHNAIYIDRTFHATEFMQSMDRIHRYGLDQQGDVICQKHSTTIEILTCENSIDQMVHENLARKMQAMYDWLNDDNLSPQLGILEPWITDEEMENFASST